jgi:hypothetical protein
MKLTFEELIKKFPI